MGSFDLPLLARHLATDGRVIGQASMLAEAATPEVRTALQHLESFTRFTRERAPEALAQVRSGLHLIIDDSLVDDAVGGTGSVRLGRAGARFLGDPINHPVVVGHELTHALGLPDANFMAEELGADLVGLAYARSIGRAPTAGDDAWRITMVDRDLRRPELPTMHALRDYDGIDTHVMAGPIGVAITRTADQIGVDAMDAIGTGAVLHELPRTSTALQARLDDLIWSDLDHAEIGRRVTDESMTNMADALLTAAAARYGRDSVQARTLLHELRTVDVRVV